MNAATSLGPGFEDPVDESQATFRTILAAMARPGTIHEVHAPTQLPAAWSGRAAVAACLTLFDFETPVWLDRKAENLAPHLRFHCNCPIVSDPAEAAFALVAAPADLPPLDCFSLGTDTFPDRSTTLIIEVDDLKPDGFVIEGPGIDGLGTLGVTGLDAGFWTARAGLAPLFPRGIDLILTAGDRLACLPRTTRVRLDR